MLKFETNFKKLIILNIQGIQTFMEFKKYFKFLLYTLKNL